MTRARRALYEAAATAASLVLIPALASPRWRSGLRERLVIGSAYGRDGDEGAIWVHGASVGEVLAARALVRRILERDDSRKVFFTTFTTTGRKTAREVFSPLGNRVTCSLMPLDWWGASGRALARMRPSLFVLLETELWPGLLDGLEARGVPSVLVNGRISAASLPRYRAMKWFFKPFLGKLSLICVRTERDGRRFRSIGAPKEKIRVTGNIKYERVSRHGPAEKVQRWQRRLGGAPLFVAGSLRRGEGKTVLQACRRIREQLPGLVLVIAPRHPDRFDRGVLAGAGSEWEAWSDLTEGEGHPSPVVLVDTVGDLPDIYAVASLAFVGGTLEDGRGHNMLEPAARGVPVLFGPAYRNFEDEAEALLDAGGGYVVSSGDDLVEKACSLLSNPAELRASGERAREAASRFEGALGRTLAAIEGVLSGAAG